MVYRLDNVRYNVQPKDVL